MVVAAGIGRSVASWTDIRSRWGQSWRTRYDQAVLEYGASIQRNAEGFRKKVEEFLAILEQSRQALLRIDVLLESSPDAEQKRRASALWQRHRTLAAGVFADTRPVEHLGAAPVVVGLVVAGVLIGLGGIAWAVAAYEYAVNLREETGLLEKELQARIEASHAGRILPPSTLPAQPSGTGDITPWLVGGLVLTVATLILPTVMGR